MAKRFDFNRRCDYDADAKAAFHSTGRARMRALAKALNLAPGTYDVRSNQGGIAVSGEVTLHAENVYVQASQSSMGASMGILIRTCEGRRDYTGGHNNFAPLDALNDIPALAARVQSVIAAGHRRF